MYVQKLELVEQELSNLDWCVHLKFRACNTLTCRSSVLPKLDKCVLVIRSLSVCVCVTPAWTVMLELYGLRLTSHGFCGLKMNNTPTAGTFYILLFM